METQVNSVGGMTRIKDRPFFCSWSGGKDSCLALYRAIKEGARPRFLLTMLTEGGERSRSHGLPLALLREQASVLGIPLIVRATSWGDYESTFLSAVHEFGQEGVELGVFGDIDLDAHREWTERICSSAGICSCLPLWGKARGDLFKELFEAGFKATICAVKEGVLDKQFLGRILNRDIVAEIESIGIDGSGEGGEYHTVVTDGPIFSAPLHLEMKGQVVRDGYCFLDVSAKGAPRCR